ncbi:MAG: hypothetical protein KF860_10345 [Cyclobacteriaceae bacterium]|nr:hypothetical protein [Cyclobacteriaceae bacterium]
MRQDLKITDGQGKNVPPIREHVIIYLMQKGLTEKRAHDFFNQYADKNWRNRNGELISNWKVHAWEWVWANKVN